MDVLCFLSWRLVPVLLLIPCTCICVTVRILNEGPVHVIPGSDLLLQAHIESSPQEQISMVTWERETKNSPTPKRLVLATCPRSSNSCTWTRPNVLAHLGEAESTFHISGYEAADGGDYIVTVTQKNGNKTSARCIVQEYEAVHHVSVSINVSHSVLVCRETWGAEPHFSWLYNRKAVTQSVGRVSQNGTQLHITQSPICGVFTCKVQNKLGYSTATYTADNCEAEEDHNGTVAAVLCVLLLLMCGGLGLVYWRRRRRNSSTRERLHEYMDDNI